MHFTHILRKKYAKNNKTDFENISQEQSALLSERLRASEHRNTKQSANVPTLTWKNFSEHASLDNSKRIKQDFFKFIEKIYSVFGGEINVSVTAYNVLRLFNRADNIDKDSIKKASEKYKVSESNLVYFCKTVKDLLRWHVETGGTRFSNISSGEKRTPKKSSKEFGKDIEFSSPYQFSDLQRLYSIYDSDQQKTKKYTTEWLCEKLNGLSDVQLFVTQIIEEINSNKSNMEIQETLFDLLGENHIETICEIISKRSQISKNTIEFCEKNFDLPKPPNEKTREQYKPIDTGVLKTNYQTMEKSGLISDSFLLPENTIFTTKPHYEEIEIPAREKSEKNIELKRVKDFDEHIQKAFGGIEFLNEIQTACFSKAMFSSDNLLVCAPTGAGKTNIALMTIIRQLIFEKSKMVYVTPMKALAREITEKFSRILKSLGLICAEFTGDMRLSKRELDKTDLVVTTPEKWDVITRKETQLARDVKLLIIDEIHLLNEDRGPVLESIVARTKILIEKAQKPIRLVGLSATLPNYIDVAEFLSVNLGGTFFFDDSYRPVPLAYDFVGINDKLNFFKRNSLMNEICYEKVIDALVNDKQVLIFVHSRKETSRTALSLLDMIRSNKKEALLQNDQPVWPHSKRIYDGNLRTLVAYGLGIHNAGMCRQDRTLAEKLFCTKIVRVLVSTATLAWGVNLPAHTVIIKGTSIYNPEKGGFVDMGGLDMMQIFGRAGRPQYDNCGKGILITTKKLLPSYTKLLTSQIPIESKFTTDLENNLNAEIVSGTVTSLNEAVDWLAYTYLYIRMKKNPLRYGIPFEEVVIDENLIHKRKFILAQVAKNLSDSRIIRYDKLNGTFFPTSLGRTASHYYIDYETVCLFMKKIRESADFITDEEVIQMFSEAKEFRQIQLREEEITELCDIEVPIKFANTGSENLNKICILIQSHISRTKMRNFTLVSDMFYVSQNIGRIARALFEICLNENKPFMAKRFLSYSKMFELQTWDFEHPLKQFNVLGEDVLHKLNSKQILVDRIREEDRDIIGELIKNRKKAEDVVFLAKCLPKLDASYVVRPITKSVLRVFAEFTPNFTWHKKYHGMSEFFWVWLEDSSSEHYIHFKDTVQVTQKNFGKDSETIKLEFLVPVPTKNAPVQFTLRTVSDRWMGTESSFPVSFKHLISPESSTAMTKLFKLNPLPKTALKNKNYESLYSFSHFNPIQTQVFHVAYHTDKNILIGAPTGSGKTLIAEIAVFRVLNNLKKHEKVVYIAPLKALAREKNRDWTAKFSALGLRVSLLTGDSTPDLQDLIRAKILITTPEKWDGISRCWANRNYVRQVSLVVIDEIHLLGTERGSVLEAIVSRIRFITEHTKLAVRIVGLSTALANPQDMAKWLGVEKIGLYNFHNDLRSVPLQIHIAGYPGKHYCPRMNAMNKPCYQSINAYSRDKPVIVFVSSRRQTRLTAFDLINFLSQNNSPQKWLRIEMIELQQILKNVKDENLKKSLEFGVGIHHAGLTNQDRKIVEELFVNNLIQILVCTATLAWGVNFPAHLVVVKGTEFYDAKTKRYVEMPLTDVLQMIGRAGRPGFDSMGVACLLVHEDKKNFYLKFLFEPFPLESSFQENLHNNINSEIASKSIKSYEDSFEYLRWTFFYQRVFSNPSYYGVSGEDENKVEEKIVEYINDLIQNTLMELCRANCIKIVNKEISSLTLGKICSFYYIDYKTAMFFHSKLTRDMSFVQILKTLSSAFEYEELPMRHNEEKMNENLAQDTKDKCERMPMDSPATKTFILFQCHMQRLEMPVCDYETDLRSVLDQSIRLLQAMIDISLQLGFFQTTAFIINVMQHIIQAIWFDEDPFINLKHVNEQHCRALTENKILIMPELCSKKKDWRNKFFKDSGISDKKLKEINKLIESMPLNVKIQFEFNYDSELIKTQESKQIPEKEERLVMVKGVVRVWDQSAKAANLVAPKWPKPRKNSWILLIGHEDSDRIYFLKRIQSVSKLSKVEVRVSFQVPLSVTQSERPFTLLLQSDSYVDFDQQLNFTFQSHEQT